jgi:hypothetical protein
VTTQANPQDSPAKTASTCRTVGTTSFYLAESDSASAANGPDCDASLSHCRSRTARRSERSRRQRRVRTAPRRPGEFIQRVIEPPHEHRQTRCNGLRRRSRAHRERTRRFRKRCSDQFHCERLELYDRRETGCVERRWALCALRTTLRSFSLRTRRTRQRESA